MKTVPYLRSPLFWASVAFVVLIVIPLYAALVVVAVRTRLLDLHGGSFTDEQYKAIWAFLGVALGTAATIMGAILTKATNDKNLAQQQEGERRQKLDTAVQALDLIKHDDAYAPKAVTAGALATLVHLGHPTIAMRATEVAIRDGAIAVPTAVWLIDQVLRAEVGESTREVVSRSRTEAADLLYAIGVGQFVAQGARLELADEPVRGSFEFPSSALMGWPTGLSDNANFQLLESLLALLVSRDYRWWNGSGGTWTWVLYSMDEMVQDLSIGRSPRAAAATYGKRLLSVLGDEWVLGPADSRDPAEVEARLLPLVDEDVSWLEHWDAVSRWCESTAAQAGLGGRLPAPSDPVEAPDRDV